MRVERDSVAHNRTINGSSRSAAAHAMKQVIDFQGDDREPWRSTGREWLALAFSRGTS